MRLFYFERQQSQPLRILRTSVCIADILTEQLALVNPSHQPLPHTGLKSPPRRTNRPKPPITTNHHPDTLFPYHTGLKSPPSRTGRPKPPITTQTPYSPIYPTPHHAFLPRHKFPTYPFHSRPPYSTPPCLPHLPRCLPSPSNHSPHNSVQPSHPTASHLLITHPTPFHQT